MPVPSPTRHLARWAAPFALLVATLLLFGGALLSGDEAVLGSPRGDMLMQYLPWRVFGFGELSRGHLALWNPHVFSGQPFQPDFQSALFYPPNLLHLAAPPRLAINLVVTLHVWLAGVFTYAWARGLRLSRTSACLAGLVYMLGAPFHLHVLAGHLTHVCTMAWTPLVFLCLDAAVRGRRWLCWPAPLGTTAWLLAGIAGGALQVLAGHPQFTYYAALASGTFAAAHVIWPSLATEAQDSGAQPPRGRLVPLVLWAALWMASAVLAGAQLLPGFEAARQSGRWQGALPSDFSASFSVPVENLLTIVAPHVYGDDRQVAYFGRWILWEVNLFAGAATMTLAAAARGRRARLAAGMCLLALLLALGSELALFEPLSRLLPGYRLFRVPARTSVVALLFLALLAGLGLDSLRRGEGLARARLVAATTSAALVVLSAIPGWKPAAAAGFVSRQLLLAALTFAACAAVLQVGRRRLRVLDLLPLLAAAELFAFAFHHRAVAPPAMPYPEAWKRLGVESDERVRHVGVHFANQGMMWGSLDVWGYDANVPARYGALMDAVDEIAAREGIHSARLAGVMRMLRWPHLLGHDAQRQPTVVPLAEDPLPRLALVARYQRVASAQQAVESVLRPEFDPSREAVLETDPVPAPAPEPIEGTARLIGSSTDSLELSVEVRRPALLLVTDAYAPGWRVVPLANEGQAGYQLLPANAVLRAVPLAAGRHHLRLEYSPPGLRAGVVLSTLGLLAYAAAWSRLRVVCRQVGARV